MNIWREQRRSGNALTDAYLQGDKRLKGHYDFFSNDLAYLRRRAEEVDADYQALRRETLGDALREYAAKTTGLSQSTEALLSKLEDRRCLVVVTGQQAGLFTGPLYTVYKAVSAVVYAELYERLLERPIVPIFWIATEDHDFDEVAAAFFVHSSGELDGARLRERPRLRTPVGAHSISEREFSRLMEHLAVALPEGMYKSDLLRDLADAFRETDNMGDFFGRLLAGFLEDFPILFLNPLQPALRHLARDVFFRVLQDPLCFRDAARAGYERVAAAGFTPQVEVQPNHSLLYLVDDGKRSALDVINDDSGLFLLRDSGKTMTREDLLQRLEERAEDFSAGVLFRPVVQDHLLPVLAYVGGAAEIAYHGMMKEIFAAVQRKVPPLHLRQRVTVIPKRVARALARYGISLEDALSRDVLREHLERDLPAPIEKVVADLQDQMSAALNEHTLYFTDIDADLAKALERSEKAIGESLKRLGGRTEAALRRNRAEMVAALSMAMNWLHPKEADQERILSPLSIVSSYGLDWLNGLRDPRLLSESEMIFIEL